MTLLIVVGIAVLVLLLRPAPRTRVVYVPVEVTEDRAGGLGCAPVIFVAALAVLVVALAR